MDLDKLSFQPEKLEVSCGDKFQVLQLGHIYLFQVLAH